jgi:hypothetical protein
MLLPPFTLVAHILTLPPDLQQITVTDSVYKSPRQRQVLQHRRDDRVFPTRESETLQR